MKVFVAIVAILVQQRASCSHVSVRLPYLNPAGVTYVNGFQGQEYPVAYGTGAAAAAAAFPQPQPLRYQSSPVVGYQSAGLRYQTPLRYQQADFRYAAAPAATIYPAKVETHRHVGYAAAQVPAVAAVPFVKHLPTVSNVPVTRYEAHHGVIEKQLDVAKPAVSTRKFEVRRPAIQKQFYDIEERVIIRPAGSALVELDEPTSKLQRGPAVLSESSPVSVTPSPFSHHLIAQSSAFSHSPPSPNAIPVVAPVVSHAPVSHVHNPIPSSSSPTVFGESNKSDDESIVVENSDFRNTQVRARQFGNSGQSGTNSGNQLTDSQLNGGLFRSSQQLEDSQIISEGQQRQYREYLRDQQQIQQSQIQQHYGSGLTPEPDVVARSNGTPLETVARFAAHDPSPSVVPSTRSSPEESRSNQRKLIDLLTARGGVAEVGFGRDGSSGRTTNAGNVRARVLSATPAPENAEPTGERVSTRRVVVSKPVETLQEIDVLEPATKFERISVRQPTLFKTAHLDHVRVHGSVPVVGQALTPTIAHTAVPVYQKTITPAVGAYRYYKR